MSANRPKRQSVLERCAFLCHECYEQCKVRAGHSGCCYCSFWHRLKHTFSWS